MHSDPGIICFKHCSDKTVFCKTTLDICPICNATITNYKLEPFRLPPYFVKASEFPVSIVIRPSIGDFLNDYVVANDLHIGIVNSRGEIIEFDEQGIVRNDSLSWLNSLALNIVPAAWTDHWDETIEIICTDEKWCTRNYHEDTFNCFTFIIEYLKLLNYSELKFTNKEDFCQNFIIPKIQDALKYISIYRKLKDSDYYVAN